MKGLVFIDIDGVILDFTSMLVHKLLNNGYPVPCPLLMGRRMHEYISESFPAVISREDEELFVHQVFKEGLLRTQPVYKHFDYKELGQAMMADNIVILTKIPPEYMADRQHRLEEVLGISLEGKLFCS